MQFGEGLVSKIYAWTWHPSNSDETVNDWLAFLALALIAAFLWSTVIKDIP